MDNIYCVSTRDVAKRLAVTERTVVNLIHRGFFPGAFKIDPTRRNSPYRIPWSDYEKYFNLDQHP